MSRWFGRAVAWVVVLQRAYRDASAGTHASAIAFHSFFSLFPLLLLALSIAGFAIADDPRARAEVARALSSAIPGARPLIGDSLDAIVAGRTGTGLVGAIGLLWTGLGAVRAAGDGVGAVLGIEPERNPVAARLWALRSLGSVGLLGLGSVAVGAALAGVSATGAVGVLLRAAVVGVSLALDVALFLTAYRLLAHGRGPPVRALLPGAALAGTGWTVLKVAGGLAGGVATGSTAVYGTFATAIGLLVMLSIAARLFMVGAVLISREAASGRARSASP